MGGEKESASSRRTRLPGSPPRGRGKVEEVAGLSNGARITPAWAGKSRFCYPSTSASWDHPRVGGEKPPSKVRPASGLRITPAWAGKSPLSYIMLYAVQDHPRVGGEKQPPDNHPLGAHGSPPRGRGKAVATGLRPGELRITPAWAGKSAFLFCPSFDVRDHPRVGGEKLCHTITPIVLTGSPPRGRGKAEKRLIYAEDVRITPAWAGKRWRIDACLTS